MCPTGTSTARAPAATVLRRPYSAPPRAPRSAAGKGLPRLLFFAALLSLAVGITSITPSFAAPAPVPVGEGLKQTARYAVHKMNPLNYSQRYLQKRLDRSVDRTKEQCLDYEKNCQGRGTHAAYSEGTIDPTTKCAQIRDKCHKTVDRRAQQATNPLSGKLSDNRVGRVEYKLWDQRELQESDEIKRKMKHTDQAAQANRNNDKNLHFFG